MPTTENILLFNKLPEQAGAGKAHRAPGITNNLLAASELANVGCELLFDNNSCEVTYNGEIILRGWCDQATQVWRASLLAEGGHNIIPPYKDIDNLYSIPEQALANNMYHPIYECQNVGQLINFYYATMGYLVISTW
jgi:hypothetical protein